jgi:hypothetical protein
MGLMVQGSNASRDKKVFSSPKCPDQLCCPSHPFSDQYCVSCLGVEQPGYEVNHSSLSIAEVKNGWSTIPLPSLYTLMAWTGINFTFFTLYVVVTGNLMF